MQLLHYLLSLVQLVRGVEEEAEPGIGGELSVWSGQVEILQHYGSGVFLWSNQQSRHNLIHTGNLVGDIIGCLYDTQSCHIAVQHD